MTGTRLPPRVVLWVSTIGFAAFGLLFVLFPRWSASQVDIQLPTNTAVVDFVATYGGFEIGVAVFLFTCLRSNERVRTGLLASGFAVAGFAIARAAAIIALGDVKPVLYSALVLESIAAAVAFWTARR
jgi:hypothetical protein